jgi:hypothetical protein
MLENVIMHIKASADVRFETLYYIIDEYRLINAKAFITGV